MNLPLTVGTAGHIDHGKTALAKALTGRDTDRLSEEKRRGISIELGFAELDLGQRMLSLIDVPGHERFVRTMISGASGIDLFLMVVAADDGMMPQTREHAAVLSALGVDLGVVALTKCDLVDGVARKEVADEVRALFPDVPLAEVSSRTGEGLAALRESLSRRASQASQRLVDTMDESQSVVLHVDRVFTIPGHGTVVTGTLWSGTIRRGDRLRLLPGGRAARVRGIEIHDRRCESAGPRQRVALNLAGLKCEEVDRGDVLVDAACELRPSYRLDVSLSALTSPPNNRERVQVHHGTREVPARVVPYGIDRVQLRLEAPIIAARGDRVVLRRIAPPDTLGGGTVLDPTSRRRRAGGELPPPAEPDPDRSVSRKPSQTIGVPMENPIAARVLSILREDGARPRGAQALADTIGADRGQTIEALRDLVAVGEIKLIKPDVFYPTAELERLLDRATALARPTGSITVAELRDALDVGRKHSQALLEHLDARKISIRHGDRHVLRASAQQDSE